MKRGEIVHVNFIDADLSDGLALCTGESKYIWITQACDNVGGEWESTGKLAKYIKYTGPTYEKGGRRFVASPEPCRLPKKGEWFYSEGIGKPVVALSSWIAMSTLDTEGHGWTRRILLEVPDLPEEHPCDLCDGKGELLTICERCHGTGELTKPDGICPTCKGGIL